MNYEELDFDLFGHPVIKDLILKEKFIEDPFSLIDTQTGHWQNRKRNWIAKGIKGEIGRSAPAIIAGTDNYRGGKGSDGNKENYTSVFDPALCEIMYKWFCRENGTILDPFAGGSVRGIVANYLDYKYTGIEIRPEQVQENRLQAIKILPESNQPTWIVGDSDTHISLLQNNYDMIFSCPPYGDLEVYSDMKGDISNMGYPDFLKAYKSIISKSCAKLKIGGFAVFVVGEFRDKKGGYVGFVPDTIRTFTDIGMQYYNEAILLNQIASASMRASGNMKSQKLVKIHQNILIFKKTQETR